MLPLKGQTQSSQPPQPPFDTEATNWTEDQESDGAVGSYLHNDTPNTLFTQGAEEEIKGHPRNQHQHEARGHWKVFSMTWTPLLPLPLLTHCPGSWTFQRPAFGGIPLPLFLIPNMCLFLFHGPVLRRW